MSASFVHSVSEIFGYLAWFLVKIKVIDEVDCCQDCVVGLSYHWCRRFRYDHLICCADIRDMMHFTSFLRIHFYELKTSRLKSLILYQNLKDQTQWIQRSSISISKKYSSDQPESASKAIPKILKQDINLELSLPLKETRVQAVCR